jgi:hypothetical protein
MKRRSEKPRHLQMIDFLMMGPHDSQHDIEPGQNTLSKSFTSTHVRKVHRTHTMLERVCGRTPKMTRRPSSA